MGWLGSQQGSLLTTTDGGKTWCQLKKPGEIGRGGGLGDSGALYFDTLKHGWILGPDRALHETDDGGVSWSKVEGARSIYSIFCLEGRCWALSNDKLFKTSRP